MTAILIFGLLLRVHYLSYTNYDEHAYDVDILHGGGHISYIKYIVENYSLPHPEKGWEYHQPPLYYLTAALVYKLTSFLNLLERFFCLQILSFVFSLDFLIYGVRLLQLLFSSSRFIAVGSLLLAVWPAMIIHSPRIGNDCLLYLFMAAAFYHSIAWFKGLGSKQELLLATIFSGLAILTKSNGVLSAVFLMILIFYRFIYSEKKLSLLKHSSYIPLVFILAIGINFSDNLYFYLKGETSSLILGESSALINPNLFVKNEFRNYYNFNTKVFLLEPFTTAWDDEYGRQFFWNQFLKTALFAEFLYPGKWTRQIGQAVSFSFLGLIGISLIGFLLAAAKTLKEQVPHYIFMGLLIAALIAFRAQIPSASHTDFRLIAPVLLPFLVIFSGSLQTFREKDYPILEFVGYLFCLLMVLGSSLFFIIPK